MSASDIRKNWFRVLDEVLAGETIVVERAGRRVILKADVAAEAGSPPPATDYSSALQGDVDNADQWSWEWSGGESDLEPRPTEPS